MQGVYYLWVVGVWIMVDGDYQFGLVKIVEGDGVFINVD